MNGADKEVVIRAFNTFRKAFHRGGWPTPWLCLCLFSHRGREVSRSEPRGASLRDKKRATPTDTYGMWLYTLLPEILFPACAFNVKLAPAPNFVTHTCRIWSFCEWIFATNEMKCAEGSVHTWHLSVKKPLRRRARHHHLNAVQIRVLFGVNNTRSVTLLPLLIRTWHIRQANPFALPLLTLGSSELTSFQIHFASPCRISLIKRP
jgi:hypothetical protein